MPVMFWIMVIGIVFVIYLIRYVVRKGVNAAGDAVTNAYKRKTNEKNAQQSENLSDRYKH